MGGLAAASDTDERSFTVNTLLGSSELIDLDKEWNKAWSD